MSQKVPRNQRRKQARDAAAAANPAPTPGEVVRRRRTKRLILLGVVAVVLPLAEVVAYRFRSILIVVVNKSDEPIRNVKVIYPGGSFGAPELKPGAEVTEAARPDYTFTRESFSNYPTTVSFATAAGDLKRLNYKAGTVDYSARETYTIQPDPAGTGVEIKHSTHPGFPLGTIRDLLGR